MTNNILIGDALHWLKRLPDESVHCVVTSPPYYGLRDYGVRGQIGLEETPEAYIETMVDVFREARRVLRNDGTLWLNIGDSYWAKRSFNGDARYNNTPGTNIAVSNTHARAGGPSHDIYKPKDLMMIPHRLAIALQADGWYVRSDIVWHKPNPMPESVQDRPTKSKEYMFLLAKSERYFYDIDAIRERTKYVRGARTFGGAGNGKHNKHRKDYLYMGDTGTRNKRDVWTIPTQGYDGAHFATMPVQLAETCIKAGCPVDGIVLDPFGGAGTTGIAAMNLNRQYLLIELSMPYAGLAQKRLQVHRLQLDNADPAKATVHEDGSKQLSLFEVAS